MFTSIKLDLSQKVFRQDQGVDYDETFSPVAMLKSVQIIIAIAAYFDYEIWQMDVCNVPPPRGQARLHLVAF